MTTRKRADETTVDEWLAAIGRVVSDTRSDRGLTERALAKLANVSRTQVHRIEAGQNSSLQQIARVIKVLGLSATIAGIRLQASTPKESQDVEVSIAAALRHLQRVQSLVKKSAK